jgi:hypothetical protein
MANKDQLSLGERYTAKFGAMPSTMLWESDPAALDALMEDAIKSGHALTDADLYRAQGINPPLPGGIK